MQKEEHKILAINPGSRYLGLAVFLGTELRDWGLKIVQGKRIADLLDVYVTRYQITVFAIKKFHPSRTSNNLRKIISLLNVYVKKHSGCIYQYSIDNIEKEFLYQKPRNKNLLEDEILSRYPFLFELVKREKKNKNPYLMRVVEAIGIGARCLQEVDTEERKVDENNRQKTCEKRKI